MSLKTKVAIVTGASSGIGAVVALKLTEEGARVVIVGRNELKLKNVSNLCEARGFKPLIVVADVTVDEDVHKIVDETIDFFGKLDILINNAGVGYTCSIEDKNAINTYDKVISTNLRSAVYLTHVAVKHLIETKGNIVNISSIASQCVLTKNSFAYCTSKAGLDHFTRCIAYELASKGVRVNSINPGPVKTEILENSGLNSNASAQIWNLMKRSTLFNKLGDPEDIGDLVVFLVSDKARSMTGSRIVSDNGSTLTGTWDHH